MKRRPSRSRSSRSRSRSTRGSSSATFRCSPATRRKSPQIVDGKDAAKLAPATPEKEKAAKQEVSTAKKVDFVLGPNKYANKEDKITIEEVRSELGTLAKGDTVTVKGTYTLASHAKATLLLSVNHKSREVQKTPSIQVQEGTRPFELKIPIECDGYLHMGFFSLQSGGSFGNLLFGTKEQMKEVANWTLEDWMENTARQRREKAPLQKSPLAPKK